MEVGSRRPRHKKRRRHDIQTDRLRIYSELQSEELKGLIIDSAVWVCARHDVVKKLDHACLGNLDGGDQMTAYINETLHNNTHGKTVRLSLDEAFFMHYALAALSLFDHKEKETPLNTSEVWQRMCSARADFPLLYVCYHHFRSKGWIPRTGLQYGVDFVLYQKHPALAHSDYSVTIQTTHPGQSINGITRPPLSWHDLQVTNRMTGQVGKRLLIVTIHDPAPHMGYTSHRCIDRLAISEYVVRRWVPERGA